MSPVGFDPTISAGERPKTYALDGTATGTGEPPQLWLFIMGIPKEQFLKTIHIFVGI